MLTPCVFPVPLQKSDPGQVLLEAVFKHLELTERDYFGLYLADDSLDAPVSIMFINLQSVCENVCVCHGCLKRIECSIGGEAPYVPMKGAQRP